MKQDDAVNIDVQSPGDGRDYEPEKEKVFLKNFSVSRQMRTIEQYNLHSEIENRDFRELKQGYHILKSQ